MVLTEGLPAYRLFCPLQAVGANLVYFDLFNASGSGVNLFIPYCAPIVSGATAVTGVVAVDLFLTYTSAIGTGGTGATLNGTSLTAATFGGMSPIMSTMPSGVTARLTPTGGATAAGVISGLSVFTEETNSATYNSGYDFVRRNLLDVPVLQVPQGYGIRVVQGSVASVGNIGFDTIIQVKNL